MSDYRRSTRFTNPQDAMRALRDKMQSSVMVPDERFYKCRSCWDSGWVETELEGRGAVKRCHNGCMPKQRNRAREAPVSSGPEEIA